MYFQRLLIVFLAFLTINASGQESFKNGVDKLVFDSGMKGAGLGIFIQNTNNDSVFFEMNSNRAMIPASTLKIVTSAAALEILGADYTYQTQLLYSGEINKQTGFLKGNLILKGGGDPTLGSKYFEDNNLNSAFLDACLNKIILSGIRGITGNIIIDESIYDEQVLPDTWIWEDMGNYYGAGANALTVYDNMFRITFKSQPKAKKTVEIVQVDPWANWLKFENYVVSSDKNSDNAYVYGDPWGGVRKLRGTIPKGQDNFQIKASLPEPGLSLGNQLKKKLEGKNIPVFGIVKKEVPGENTKLIYVLESPKLSEIIKVLNHESVNLFAEHLAKQIAYEQTGLGSTQEGVKIIKEFWQEKGIDTVGMFLEDGSGLSHFNAISPKQLVGILNYMNKESENFGVFKYSLPAPGEGTLYYFDSNDFPSGSLFCKSGSMTRVRCYAGYLDSKKNGNLAFSIMVNNFSLSHSELIKNIEVLLEDLYK